MRNILKTLALCALMAMAMPLATPAHAQIGFSIHVGAPFGPPPPPVPEVVVAAPFAGAVWVPGYYVFDYGIHRYHWIGGAWQRPPYAGARWIAPRYGAGYGGRYGAGGFGAGHWDRGGVVARTGNFGRGNFGRGNYGGRGGGFSRSGRAPMAR